MVECRSLSICECGSECWYLPSSIRFSRFAVPSYQLAPSFVGFAELNDAAYVQTILNVING